ncbi:MAG: hypothetical protein HFF07_04575 [Oscillospiraceae bacterium]|nr:hypothetical protein [Oscillospiraceae bacterium]
MQKTSLSRLSYQIFYGKKSLDKGGRVYDNLGENNLAPESWGNFEKERKYNIWH